VGSHTLSHPDLRRLGAAAVERELRVSRERLEERLGTTVDSFCYPRGLWNRRVERQVRQAYRSAVVGGGRRMVAGAPIWRMTRTSVRQGFGSLRPLLTAPLYVEEWLADVARRLR
jgi:peptidoglycan/xylan/chitin deacetylase (PgdA/CDA1 family)